MLNYRSKPSYDEIFIEIDIWGADLVLCSVWSQEVMHAVENHSVGHT